LALVVIFKEKEQDFCLMNGFMSNIGKRRKKTKETKFTVKIEDEEQKQNYKTRSQN